MMMISRYGVCLLMVVVVAYVSQVTEATWTQAYRDQITKIHNDYRKAAPGACDMKLMKYDMELEKEAQAWAGKCEFKHQQKGRGENIAWYTKYTQESTLIQKMSKMWHDEVTSYTYGEYSCGSACHYTQMVWSDSTKVGCYAQHCAQLKNGGNNAYFLVCFYDPAGNMMGEQPYKKDCSAKANEETNSGTGNPEGGEGDWEWY